MKILKFEIRGRKDILNIYIYIEAVDIAHVWPHVYLAADHVWPLTNILRQF